MFSTGGASQQVSAVSNGPQLGYAWDTQDETLRPILGVPGSSQVGTSVVTAGAFVAAAASSPANLALLVGTDHQLYRMTLPNGAPAQIGATAAAGSVIRFSPSGTAAIVYTPGGTSATLLTGLSSSPKLRAVSLPAAIVDGAASDAGTVVAEVQGSGAVAIDVVAASGAVQTVASVQAPGGLSFAGTSEDLLVADAGANSMMAIRSVSTTPLKAPISTAGLLKVPVGLGASLSGQWAVVANSGDSSVVRVDLSGASAPQRVVCPAQPTVVAQLSGNGVFRFNELGTAPVWLADVSAATPAMLFIPALPKPVSAVAVAEASPVSETIAAR
jgi:hypothetical protein